MASKAQMTGMLGVYLTAVELIKLGFIVSPTSRSAMGADLLVTDQHCRKSWSIQVKTNASTAKFWLMAKHAKEMASSSHVYVFVSVPKNAKRQPAFYVVPSKTVAESIRTSRPTKTRKATWYSWFRDDEQYKDRWQIFGNPLGELPARAA